MNSAVAPVPDRRRRLQSAAQPVILPPRVEASDGCLGATLNDRSPRCENCVCEYWLEHCDDQWGEWVCGDWEWECANTRPCAFETFTLEVATASNGTVTIDDTDEEDTVCRVDLTAHVNAALNVTVMEVEGCPRSRLWCGDESWGWLLAFFSLLACFATVLVRWWLWVRRSRGDPSKEEQGIWGYFYKPKKKELPTVTAERLEGLNAARLLASIHIVLGHLYAKGAVSSVYYFGWGFSWVPWFFMLSGYVLTHAQLGRKVPSYVDPIPVFIRKRTSAIFPLYAFGLVVALALLMGADRSVPEWWVLFSQSFLTQAWFPWLTEQTIQLHCWFLSALIPYWLLFGLLMRFVILKLHRLWTLTIVLFFLQLPPWFQFMFPAVLEDSPTMGEWYVSHRTGALDDPVDYWVVFLKFHPICYLHVFVFGMVLARLRERLKVTFGLSPREPPPDFPEKRLGKVLYFCVSWGAFMGYTILVTIFLVPKFRPFAAKLSARLTIFMVPQGLILLGLSPIRVLGAREQQAIRGAMASGQKSLKKISSAISGSVRDGLGSIRDAMGSVRGGMGSMRGGSVRGGMGSRRDNAGSSRDDGSGRNHSPNVPRNRSGSPNRSQSRSPNRSPTRSANGRQGSSPTLGGRQGSSPTMAKKRAGPIPDRVMNGSVYPKSDRDRSSGDESESEVVDDVVAIEVDTAEHQVSRNSRTGTSPERVKFADSSNHSQSNHSIHSNHSILSNHSNNSNHDKNSRQLNPSRSAPGSRSKGVTLKKDPVIMSHKTPQMRRPQAYVASDALGASMRYEPEMEVLPTWYPSGRSAGVSPSPIRANSPIHAIKAKILRQDKKNFSEGKGGGGKLGASSKGFGMEVEDDMTTWQRVRIITWDFITHDPISRIFAFAPAAWGNVSYAQYVLQLIAYQVWPVWYLDSTLFPFLVFLLAISWLAAVLVVEPSRIRWINQKPPPWWRGYLLWLVPVLTCVILLAMAVPYNLTRTTYSDSPVPLGPAYVTVSEGECVDVKLNWTVPESFGDLPPGALTRTDTRAVINPSLLLVGGRLVRAARASALHEYRDEGVWEGMIVTEITSAWRSDFVFSDTVAYDLSGWDVAAWGLDDDNLKRVWVAADADAYADAAADINAVDDEVGAGWAQLCEPVPTYIPQNETLLRKTVSGPEDPKLFPLPEDSIHGPWAVAFSSLPPVSHRPGCDQISQAVSQMYIAAAGEDFLDEGVAVGVRLDCGFTEKPEKNWIAFSYEGQLYFVYSIFPHVVVQARASDGACRKRYTTTNYKPLEELSQVSAYGVHGSATAVPYKGAFLALMHVVDGEGQYVTMAYKFEASPPFSVLEVSRPLPMQGAGNANFASGLLVPEGAGKVIVTYGAADRESRALVMSTQFFDELFQCRPVS